MRGIRWRPAAAPVTLVFVVLALAWTALLGRLHVAGLSSPLDDFEDVCLDVRYALSPARPPPAEVVLVAIDDEALRQAGSYPLPRPALASIVEAVIRQKPKAIALDLLLIAPGPADADARLGAALRAVPAVIAAAGLFGGDPSDPETPGRSLAALPRPSRLLWPAEPMAGAAEVGLVNISTGHGGAPRHVPLLFQGPDGIVPSFALLAAALASGQTARFSDDGVAFGARHVPLDLRQTLVIRYYGPRGTIPTVSSRALGAADTPSLAGRVVVIGATAVGSGDMFANPFSTVVPGAEILATAIDNLLAGDGLVRTRSTRWLDVAAAAGLALASVALLARRRGVLGLALVLLLAVGWLAVTLLAFTHRTWLSATLPIAAMAPVAALHGSVRLWQDRRAALRLAGVAQGLRAFSPRPLSDLLASDPQVLDRPLVQDAAILFIDLSGYTSLSETTDAVRMRDLLKSFHALVDEIVDRHGGFVVNFMGDGAMVLFGFPRQNPDDAARALGALLQLETRLADWGGAQTAVLPRHVPARLSAHFGPVVISRLGGETHQQITATGDTVNVASRLLEVAKLNRVSTVVTDEIVGAAGATAATGRFSAAVEVPIRGRQQSVRVRLAGAVQP